MMVVRRLGSFRRFALIAEDGEAGRVADAYFDDRAWIVRYLAVEAAAAPGATVLVEPGSIIGIDEENACLRTRLTRQQVAQCPAAADVPPVSSLRQQRADARLFAGSLWGRGQPRQAAAAATTSVAPGAGATSSRLRSCEEVTGYLMVARDGVVGHVLDFVVELPEWNVRFIEVEWRGWHPAQRVLVEPRWVTGIDWLHREVTTDRDRKGIAAASPRGEPSHGSPPAAASYPATTSSSSAVIASCLARR